MPIRVLIVDDSAFMRRELTRLIDAHPDFEVIATASNGADGVRKAAEHQPDAVTLDVEMPEMSGIQALPMILRSVTPKPRVMMCSSLTKEGSREALQALRLGAADVIAKEGSSITGVPRDPNTGIVPKLRALFPEKLEFHRPESNQASPGSKSREIADRIAAKAAKVARERVSHASSAVPHEQFGERQLNELLADNRGFEAVVIGSSTGGPPALEALLGGVPSTASIPIIIAQHMPSAFTESLAERLDSVCRARVIHATETTIAQPGSIYLVQGGREGTIKNNKGAVELAVDAPSEGTLYKPSVDALYSSAAEAFDSKIAAFQMTGMGQDGLIGARALRAKGAVIACQDQDSCVVWGMPRAVYEAKLADASLPPEKLNRALTALSARPKRAASAA